MGKTTHLEKSHLITERSSPKQTDTELRRF